LRERHLALRALLHDPRTIEISVEDSGVGVAPEDARCVFDPFFTTKPQRSGLGLAICRNIIDAHGEDISFGPGQGCGAAFRVRLPASS
jgi:signal transduction histidine kinase